MIENLTRRQLLATASIGLGLSAVGGVMAGPSLSFALPYPRSMAEALDAALKKHSPLVVMVSLEGCPFCKAVRDSYLAPMLREGQAPVVQVDVRSAMAVDNFQGVATTHDDITRAWGIKVAPTVLFFGPNGREVAKRLVGSYIPDFYGSYLDDRLAQAKKALG